MSPEKGTVFIVDDDPSICAALARLFKSVGLPARSFAGPRDFLDQAPQLGPGCLVLDMRLPGLSGLDLQGELARAGIGLPIIFLTAHGSVPLSVQAMKAGAVDFLEKPVEDQTLLDAVSQALERDRQARLIQARRQALQELFATLTPRERQVFQMVATGRLNKEIAFELGTAVKTVKVHRGNLMRKLNCRSLAELVRLAQELKTN
ncbi:MAG: response regulator transcription factor [Syntrophobacterales bacterium]|jgi:FixJ family two-component response regulator|nr:response regulator transcription factor [Syntrophobacterales bacterium]